VSHAYGTSVPYAFKRRVTSMEDAKSLSITADGTATCRPDTCVVLLYAEGLGSSIGGATAKCDSIVERVSEAVRGSFKAIIAIKEVQIFTGAVYSDPFSSRTRVDGKACHVRQLALWMPVDASLAQQVADVALVSGATLTPSVMDTSFHRAHSAILYSFSGFDSVRQQAYEVAIATARQDAVALLKGIGKRCGTILSVVDILVPSDYRDRSSWGHAILPFPLSRMSESPEELRVMVKVRVKFEMLEPSRSAQPEADPS
jgi:hypothetical protein